MTEASRAFLLGLLDTITDAQLRDIFTASRITERGEGIGDRAATVEDWLAVPRQACGAREAVRGSRTVRGHPPTCPGQPYMMRSRGDCWTRDAARRVLPTSGWTTQQMW